jgi:hypothetical protein
LRDVFLIFISVGIFCGDAGGLLRSQELVEQESVWQSGLAAVGGVFLFLVRLFSGL